MPQQKLLAIFLRRDLLEAVEVRAQGFGDEDRAVGLLIILNEGKPGAANSEPAAIQSVEVFRFPALPSSEPQVGAPRLKGLEVRTGRSEEHTSELQSRL